jgi:hypothetical protein
LATPVTPTNRQLTARRLQAARVLAGGPSLHDLARGCGLSYRHLVAAANADEPLTSTDLRDLAAVLEVPPSWLAHGWTGADAAT